MTTKERKEQKRLADELGGASQIHEGLQAYSQRVEHMETLRPELLERHPNKWVAMADGEVVVVADSMTDLLKVVDDRGIPRTGLVVEYLDTEPRNMIL